MKYLLLLFILIFLQFSLANEINLNIDVINSSICNVTLDLLGKNYFLHNESMLIRPEIVGSKDHSLYYEVWKEGVLLENDSIVRQRTLKYVGEVVIKLVVNTSCYNIGTKILEKKLFKPDVRAPPSQSLNSNEEMESNLITGRYLSASENDLKSYNFNWLFLSALLLLVLIIFKPINLYNKSE